MNGRETPAWVIVLISLFVTLLVATVAGLCYRIEMDTVKERISVIEQRPCR